MISLIGNGTDEEETDESSEDTKNLNSNSEAAKSRTSSDEGSEVTDLESGDREVQSSNLHLKGKYSPQTMMPVLLISSLGYNNTIGIAL